MIENILGWIGNFGFILGAILLSHKNKYGFISQVLANVFYIIQSLLYKNYSLFWLSIILICLNLKGFYFWNYKK